VTGLQRENGNLDLVVAKLRVKIIELEKEIGALSVQLLDMDESLAESVFVSSTVKSTW
jgi:hypothetical protein